VTPCTSTTSIPIYEPVFPDILPPLRLIIALFAVRKPLVLRDGVLLGWLISFPVICPPFKLKVPPSIFTADPAPVVAVYIALFPVTFEPSCMVNIALFCTFTTELLLSFAAPLTPLVNPTSVMLLSMVNSMPVCPLAPTVKSAPCAFKFIFRSAPIPIMVSLTLVVLSV